MKHRNLLKLLNITENLCQSFPRSLNLYETTKTRQEEGQKTFIKLTDEEIKALE